MRFEASSKNFACYNYQTILAEDGDHVRWLKPKTASGSGKCGGGKLYSLCKLVSGSLKPSKPIDEHNMVRERRRATKGVVQGERPSVCVRWEIGKARKIRLDGHHV